MPSMQTGTAQVAVNETAPLGVLFVTRPPSLRAEPPREEHDQSKDDTKMEDVCERIRRVRRQDLSSEGLAFWEVLGQLHRDGRRAASVPSMPHTKEASGHTFTFDGCPQPLLPLLRDLARFPRPLITWDLFNDAPPAEFQAPSSLQIGGPDAGSGSGHRSGSSSATSSSALAALGAPPSGEDTPGLRSPRRANAVGHQGYSAAAQSRDAASLKLEDWLENYPGHLVETVETEQLYFVRLDEPDGEFKMGLVVTRGKPFDKAIMGADGKEETAKHMSAEWFKRKNDTSHAWPKNPAFEPHGATDDLPIDSFLLKVEDAELTDAGVKEKWQYPKFKEVFLVKLRGIADKYPQLRTPAKASKRARVAAAGASAADLEDDIGMLLEANRQKLAGTAAMKERVRKDMAAAMDTGVHANPILAAAYGIHVEQPLGGDGSGAAVDAQAAPAAPAAMATATPAVAPQEGLSAGFDDDAALAINGQDEEAAVVEALRRSRETLGLADTVAAAEAYAEAVRRSYEDAAAKQAVWDIGRAVVASQGFTEQECGADGNCLYRSAARQLREYDFRLGRHRDVRLRVVAYIREHRAHYMEHAHEGLVDLVRAHLELEYDEVDLDALVEPCLELMEEDKHWAESEFELRAIADAFGATVVKVSASPDVALVRYEPDSMSGISAVADQPVIHLVHYHGLHYRAGFADDDRAPYTPTAPAAPRVATRQLPPRSTREKTAQQ
jgi:hypothetical protein